MSHLSRRLVLSLTVLAAVSTMQPVRLSAQPGATLAEPATTELQQIAAASAQAANTLLEGLTEAQRARVQFDYEDPARLDWHNIPKPQRKGVQLRELTEEQRGLVLNLLKTVLSDSGFETAERIMSLETNLYEGEKQLTNGQLRDPLRYFVSIFGTPGDEGRWGWSFEGHHFSQNFAFADGEFIGTTPSFWGANPSIVHVFVNGGPSEGTRTLAREEQLAFDLLGKLDKKQLQQAVIADKAPDEYRNAGQPEPPREKAAGIAASDLSNEQRAVLNQLLQGYLSHLEPALAAAEWQELEAAGLDEVTFAWLGATKPGVGHSYRVQGPTFLLELINVQSDPQGTKANHIHSVWRSLTHDFGVAAH